MISYLRRPFKKNKLKTVTTTVAERQDAEIHIFKELQRSAFKNEIANFASLMLNTQSSYQDFLT